MYPNDEIINKTRKQTSLQGSNKDHFKEKGLTNLKEFAKRRIRERQDVVT